MHTGSGIMMLLIMKIVDVLVSKDFLDSTRLYCIHLTLATKANDLRFQFFICLLFEFNFSSKYYIVVMEVQVPNTTRNSPSITNSSRSFSPILLLSQCYNPPAILVSIQVIDIFVQWLQSRHPSSCKDSRFLKSFYKIFKRCQLISQNF